MEWIGFKIGSRLHYYYSYYLNLSSSPTYIKMTCMYISSGLVGHGHNNNNNKERVGGKMHGSLFNFPSSK